MTSTVVTVQNELFEFQFKRYLPILEEAPNLAIPQPLPKQMPALTAMPKASSIRKRRNSEYFPSKSATTTHVTLDDSIISTGRKRHRRTKQQIINDHLNEYISKQVAALEKFRDSTKNQISKAQVTSFPRTKTVNHTFNQISNMAFAVCREKNLFKCVSSWCNFKTVTATNFEIHLERFHELDKSLNSFSVCMICNAQTNATNLKEEFQHLKTHLSRMSEIVSLDDLINTLSASKESFEREAVKEEEYCSKEATLSTVDHLKDFYDVIEAEVHKLHEGAHTISNFKKQTILTVETTPAFENNKNKPGFEMSSSGTDDLPCIAARKEILTPCSGQVSETSNCLSSSAQPKRRNSNTESGARLLQCKKRTESSELMQNLPTGVIKRSSSADSEFKLANETSLTSSNTFNREYSKFDQSWNLKCEQNIDSQTKLSAPIQRRFSISSKPDERKTFKRSLSVVNSLSQASGVGKVKNQPQTNTETPTPKKARSDVIDKLIVEEKSAGLTIKPPPSPLKPSMPQLDKPEPVKPASKVILKRTVLLDFFKKSSPSEIMPWMDKACLRKNDKFEVCYNRMKQPSSLAKLFKCMDSMCSFATDDCEIFLNHLVCHYVDKERKDCFFLYCAYCTFRASEEKSLVIHVNKYHTNDAFQCSRCFYRSFDKETCYHHVKQIHREPKTVIFKSKAVELTEEQKVIMFQRLERKRKDNVSSITCQCELFDLFTNKMFRVKTFNLIFLISCLFLLSFSF